MQNYVLNTRPLTKTKFQWCTQKIKGVDETAYLHGTKEEASPTSENHVESIYNSKVESQNKREHIKFL